MNNFPQTDANGKIIALDAKGNVSIDCITEDTIVVQGVVDFSHITRMYIGQELAAENARRTQRGLTPMQRPFTQITIKNASVVMNNPQAKSVNDYYAESKMLFASKKYPEKGFCCTGTNKGNSLPAVFQRDASDPKKVQQFIPDGEPAQGLKVTLVFRPFKPKKVGMHTGITLDSVIIDEPFQKASFGGAASLAGLGLDVTTADSEAINAYNKAGYAPGMPDPAAQTPMQTAPAQYGQYNQPQYVPQGNMNQFVQPDPAAQTPMQTAPAQYGQYNQPFAPAQASAQPFGQPMQTAPAQYGQYNQPQQYAPQGNMNQFAQPAPFAPNQALAQNPAPVQQEVPAAQAAPAPAVVPATPAQPADVNAYGGITLED